MLEYGQGTCVALLSPALVYKARLGSCPQSVSCLCVSCVALCLLCGSDTSLSSCLCVSCVALTPVGPHVPVVLCVSCVAQHQQRLGLAVVRASPGRLPGAALLLFKEHLGSVLTRVEGRKTQLDTLTTLYEFYDSVSLPYQHAGDISPWSGVFPVERI